MCPFVVLQGITLEQNRYHEEGSYLLKEKGIFLLQPGQKPPWSSTRLLFITTNMQ